MKPTWFDWIVYRYYWRRWKKYYKESITLTAIHIAKMDAIRPRLPDKAEDDTPYHEEL